MENFVYEWKPQSRFTKKADPNKVAAEINSIGESARPEQIVALGTNKDTELHKCFEWDDTIAANKYRIEQAKDIAESLLVIRIKPEKTDEPTTKLRAMYHLPGTPGYQQSIQIVRNEDKYQRLLEQAKTELRMFKAKYSMLSELQDIFDMID